MVSRIVNITACCFLAVSPVALHGQGPDAQDLTQSVLDQHKSADPTNSDRALTGKSRQSEPKISEVRLPSSGPSPETVRRVNVLEKERNNFVKDRIQTEEKKQSESKKLVLFNRNIAESNAKKAWEQTDSGKTLRRLRAEVAEASKKRERAEPKISDVPLPTTH
jgi:hypothetical protein